MMASQMEEPLADASSGGCPPPPLPEAVSGSDRDAEMGDLVEKVLRVAARASVSASAKAGRKKSARGSEQEQLQSQLSVSDKQDESITEAEMEEVYQLCSQASYVGGAGRALRMPSARKDLVAALSGVSADSLRTALRENIRKETVVDFVKAVFLGSPRWGSGSKQGLDRRLAVYSETLALVGKGDMCIHKSSKLTVEEKKHAETLLEYLADETEQLPESTLPFLIQSCLNEMESDCCPACCSATLLGFVPKMLCRSSCFGERVDPDQRCKRRPEISKMNGLQYQTFVVKLICAVHMQGKIERAGVAANVVQVLRELSTALTSEEASIALSTSLELFCAMGSLCATCPENDFPALAPPIIRTACNIVSMIVSCALGRQIAALEMIVDALAAWRASMGSSHLVHWLDVIEGNIISKFSASCSHYPSLRKAVMKTVEVRFGYASALSAFHLGLVLAYARIKYFDRSSNAVLKRLLHFYSCAEAASQRALQSRFLNEACEDCAFSLSQVANVAIDRSTWSHFASLPSLTASPAFAPGRTGWELVLPVALELGVMILDGKGLSSKEGAALLGRLFVCSDVLRREILGRISSHLMTLTSLQPNQRATFGRKFPGEKTDDGYVQLLSDLCRDPAALQLLLDRNMVQRIKDVFNYLPSIASDLANAVIDALRPIIKAELNQQYLSTEMSVHGSGGLIDHLSLMCRKGLFQPEIRQRLVAIHGFSTLLSLCNESGASEQEALAELRSDAVACLRRCLHQPKPVREALYDSMRDLIGCDALVRELIVPHCSEYFEVEIQDAAEPCLDVRKCLKSCNGSYSVLEPFPHLLMTLLRCEAELPEYFKAKLCMLSEKLSESSMETFAIDKLTRFYATQETVAESDDEEANTKKSTAESLTVKLVVEACEALMNVTNNPRGRLTSALKLFACQCKWKDAVNSFSAPGSGNASGSKRPSKKAKPSIAKPTFAPSGAFLNRGSVLQLLQLLIDEGVDGHKPFSLSCDEASRQPYIAEHMQQSMLRDSRPRGIDFMRYLLAACNVNYGRPGDAFDPILKRMAQCLWICSLSLWQCASLFLDMLLEASAEETCAEGGEESDGDDCGAGGKGSNKRKRKGGSGKAGSETPSNPFLECFELASVQLVRILRFARSKLQNLPNGEAAFSAFLKSTFAEENLSSWIEAVEALADNVLEKMNEIKAVKVAKRLSPALCNTLSTLRELGIVLKTSDDRRKWIISTTCRAYNMNYTLLSGKVVKVLSSLAIEAGDAFNFYIPVVLSRAIVESVGSHLKGPALGGLQSRSTSDGISIRSSKTCVAVNTCVLAHISKSIEECEHLLAHFKAHPLSLEIDVEREMSELGVLSGRSDRKSGRARYFDRCGKAKLLFSRLEVIVSALHLLAGTAWPSSASSASVSLLRTLVRAYKVIGNAMANHAKVIKLCSKVNVAEKSVEVNALKKLVSRVGKRLTPVVYAMLSRLQSPEMLKRSNSQNIKRESSVIPGLILQIENFEVALLKLTKCSKLPSVVELNALIRRSTVRDFRLTFAASSASSRNSQRSTLSEDSRGKTPRTKKHLRAKSAESSSCSDESSEEESSDDASSEDEEDDSSDDE